MSETRFEAAEQILRSAGELLARHLGLQLGAEEKEPEHFSIPVDLAVDRAMIKAISQKFPDDQLFTEESYFVGSESAYLWIVDPVDGTSNLKLGIPYAATSLALQRFGEIVFSAVYNPFLDEMIVAEKGAGAYLNGNRISVSDKTSPSVGYYVQGYRVPPPVQLEVLRVLLPAVYRVLHTWAPTLDWCNIARGRAEFLIGYDTEIEDLLQGKLILEEAGGRVSAWDRRPIAVHLEPRHRVSVVASNGATHDQICSLLEHASIEACLRGYISLAEEQSLNEILECLSHKLQGRQGSVADRMSAELGLPPAVWSRNRDLQYLVKRAEALRNNPKAFLAHFMNGIASHLSGEEARQSLLQTLRSVAETWNPEEYFIEIAAQALEIAASDIRLYDRMRHAGYPQNVIESLRQTLPKDSFAVGVRLKRNALREIQALERGSDLEPLGPIRQLAELPLSECASQGLREGTAAGFAALIITGGRGTRLRSSIPKGLIPLGGRPLINHTIDALRAAGASHIVVVIGYKSAIHQSILAPDLTLVLQPEQLGSAHAVMVAKRCFTEYKGPLLVCYSDMPFVNSRTLGTLVNKHLDSDAVLTLLTTDRKNRPEFGRLLRRGERICGIGQVRFEAMESDEVDAGFYCFKAPDFWNYLGRVQNDNNRREFQFTEIVACLAEDNQKIGACFVGDVVQTIGINRPSEYIEAERITFMRSKIGASDAGLSAPGSELDWKLRFYEAYGGLRADEIQGEPNDPVRLSNIKTIIASYDDALEQEIGPIFDCPKLLTLT